MENMDIQENMFVEDIGQVAKRIDIELTMLERMKIKKSTLKRIMSAVIIYIIAMLVFTILL